MKNTNEINRVGNNTTYLNKQITMQIVAASGILEEPVGWVSVFLPRKCSVNETILVNYKRVVRLYCLIWTFPGSQLEKNPLALQETLIWFPGVSVGKESTMLETWVRSLGWEDPLEEGLATHSSILAWRSPLERRAWRAAVMGLQRVGHDWATKHSTTWTFPDGSVVKNPLLMQETQVWSLDQEDPLEKEMATHSRIHAWRIPRTEEPWRLQFMGWQSIRDHWAQTHRSMINKITTTKKAWQVCA